MIAGMGPRYESIQQVSKVITHDVLKIFKKINNIKINLISVDFVTKAEFKLSEGDTRQVVVETPIILEEKDFDNLSESWLESEIVKVITFNYERLATMNIPNILAAEDESNNIEINTETCSNILYKTSGGTTNEGSYYWFPFMNLDEMQNILP